VDHSAGPGLPTPASPVSNSVVRSLCARSPIWWASCRMAADPQESTPWRVSRSATRTGRPVFGGPQPRPVWPASTGPPGCRQCRRTGWRHCSGSGRSRQAPPDPEDDQRSSREPSRSTSSGRAPRGAQPGTRRPASTLQGGGAGVAGEPRNTSHPACSNRVPMLLRSPLVVDQQDAIGHWSVKNVGSDA
jgi:hypothetical protein